MVLWDATTRFVAAWSTPGLQPAACARHPRRDDHVFVLDRRGNRSSRVFLLAFDGDTLSPVRGYPRPVDVGDSDHEMGLAAAVEPAGGRLLLAVTDAARRRVLELEVTPSELRSVASHSRLASAPAGGPALAGPTDAAYTLQKDTLGLFVVDGHDRLGRIR